MSISEVFKKKKERGEEQLDSASKVLTKTEIHDWGGSWEEGLLFIPKQAGKAIKLVVPLLKHISGGNVISEYFGNYLGAEMSDGTVISNKCRNKMGNKMSGGLIVSNESGNGTGFKMRGGTIISNKAKNGTGSLMSNGTLISNESGQGTGYGMSGGTLISKESKRGTGFGMFGGALISEKSGNNAGKRMSNGMIISKKSGKNTGQELFGGTLISNKAGDKLGNKMFKGTIISNEAGDKLGKNMYGGTIYCASISSIKRLPFSLSFLLSHSPKALAKIYTGEVIDKESKKDLGKGILHENKKFAEPIQNVVKWAMEKQEMIIKESQLLFKFFERSNFIDVLEAVKNTDGVKERAEKTIKLSEDAFGKWENEELVKEGEIHAKIKQMKVEIERIDNE